MDPLAPLISALHEDGRLRVWSLVVTVLGDVAQPRGGRIALARLQEIMSRIGVESGALRTALSRLTADGWVTRERSGRTSWYRLSERGQAEYVVASRRVYAPPSAQPEHWTLALVESDTTGGYDLGNGWRLFAGVAPEGTMVAVEGSLSISEAGRTLCPQEPRVALTKLKSDLAVIQSVELSPRDALAARVLLVHRWRRFVLRYPELPGPLLPSELANSRTMVASTYETLLTQSEKWLDMSDAGLDPMEAADDVLLSRFKKHKK